MLLSQLTPIGHLARTATLAAISLVAAAGVARAEPVVFYLTLATKDESIAACEARATQALTVVAGNQRPGVESIAFFGVTADDITASVACTAIDARIVTTVVTAGDASFERVKEVRDLLLQVMVP